MSKDFPHRVLTKEFFFELLEEGHVIDARMGGYVVGRSQEQFGIKCYAETTSGAFVLTHQVEGGEYIINPTAADTFKEELEKMSIDFKLMDDAKVCLPIGKYTTVYNTGGSHEKILWVSYGCFIVNQYATLQYFSTLEKMNFEANIFRHYSLE